MKNLQEATERICELKGNVLALDALAAALLTRVPAAERPNLLRQFNTGAELAQAMLLNAPISEHTISAFGNDAARLRSLLTRSAPTPPRPVVEPVMLAATSVRTFIGSRALTGASGFIFERDSRLYCVTSRHVVWDPPTGHYPDALEIGWHLAGHDLTRFAWQGLPLYRQGQAIWRQARDSAGDVDVAVVPIDRDMLPDGALVHALTPRHLVGAADATDPADAPHIGTPLVIVGFPLGFEDTVHHLPVARQAAVASAFGTRFQGQGLFLTDARTHRGSSGAPVLMPDHAARLEGQPIPWRLLGVHSTRMDMRTRDWTLDESLGLNCAWYADVLMALTLPGPPA